MQAAILSIGAELLRGDIQDTNAPFLARELSQLGFDVRRIGQTGDVLPDLMAELRSSLDVAQVVLCTGGLGPTQDDLTRHGVAGVLGEEVTIDENLVREIEHRFRSMRRPMPERNRQQAQVVPSASAVRNPNGTAPGWFVERDGTVIVTMPGPPSEMQPMWRDSIKPRLQALLPGSRCQRALMTFGLGESTVEQMIDDVIAWRDDVIVATYAKESGVQVHITAIAADQCEAASRADDAELQVRARLGDSVFGVGDTSLAAVVGGHLVELGETVAVMESATGGQLASALTDVEGSSQYFVSGIVAYTKEAKSKNGVDAAVMASNGLISAETARAMAVAARIRTGASIGLSTTGIAGSDPIEGKPAGTCYVAVSMGETVAVREIHRAGSRTASKRYFSQCALDLLRRTLSERHRL